MSENVTLSSQKLRSNNVKHAGIMRYFNINLSLMFSSFSQDYKFLKAITRTSFKLFNSVFFKLAVILQIYNFIHS